MKPEDKDAYFPSVEADKVEYVENLAQYIGYGIMTKDLGEWAGSYYVIPEPHQQQLLDKHMERDLFASGSDMHGAGSESSSSSAKNKKKAKGRAALSKAAKEKAANKS